MIFFSKLKENIFGKNSEKINNDISRFLISKNNLFFLIISIIILFITISSFFLVVFRSYVISNVGVSIQMKSNISNYDDIKVLRICFSGVKWALSQSYVQTADKLILDYKTEQGNPYKGIYIEVPKTDMPLLEKVNVKIGAKEFNFTKQDLLDKWSNTDEGKYIGFTSPLLVKSSVLPVIKNIINWGGDSLIIYIFILAVVSLYLFILLIIRLNNKQINFLFWILFFLYLCMISYCLNTNGDEPGYIASSRIIFSSSYDTVFFKDWPFLYLPYALIASWISDNFIILTRIVSVIAFFFLFYLPITSNKLFKTQEEKFIYFILLFFNSSAFPLNLTVRQYPISNFVNLLLLWLLLYRNKPVLQGIIAGIAFSCRINPLFLFIPIVFDFVKKQLSINRTIQYILSFGFIIGIQMFVWKITSFSHIPGVSHAGVGYSNIFNIISLSVTYFKQLIIVNPQDIFLVFITMGIIVLKIKNLIKDHVLIFLFAVLVIIAYVPMPSWEHYIDQIILFSAMLFAIYSKFIKKTFLITLISVYIMIGFVRGLFGPHNYIVSQFKQSTFLTGQQTIMKYKKLYYNGKPAFDLSGISYVSGFGVNKKFPYPAANYTMIKGCSTEDPIQLTKNDYRVYTREDIITGIRSQAFPIVILYSSWNPSIETELNYYYDKKDHIYYDFYVYVPKKNNN
jgi:hypothetical protein